MLEPWIIEQIRRREEEERRRQERPRLDVPMRDERWKREQDPQAPVDEGEDEGRDKSDRGVLIIDI